MIRKSDIFNFFNRLKQQFFHMLFIGALFAIIGTAVPDIYFKYFDTTQYYSLSQPISVDKTTYTPCEKAILSSSRISLTDLVVSASNSLIKIEDDNTILRVYEAPDRISLVVEQSTGKPVAFILDIPCDAEEGTYFWQGAIKYSIHGVEKTYLYTTDLFNISLEAPNDNLVNEESKFTMIQNN